jgi:hypothetical protein
MAFIRPSDTPALPIQAVHVLRAVLLHREEEDTTTTTQAEEDRLKRQKLIAKLSAGQVAKAIIKNEAADRRMHALAIARRLHYCLTG